MPTPLELRIGPQVLRFDSLEALEFALDGRTSVPVSRVAALPGLGPQKLLAEVSGIRRLERRLVQAIEQGIDDPRAVGAFLDGLDPASVSQDHQWRAIVGSMRALGPQYDEYKRVVLVKYMQYLSARQEMAKLAYTSSGDARAGPGAGPGGSRPSETLFLETLPPAGDGDQPQEFGRLPKGETVEISLIPEQGVTVLLARHRFSIRHDGELWLVDENDRARALRRGRNIVGRDTTSDVVVDPNLRTVSRRHLIVDADRHPLVRLTDISSLGTFLPSEYLERTGL